MTTLSTSAWTAHNVGLATAIGGTLYGRTALQPALQDIQNPEERDRIAADAWQRFGWMNLAAHGVFAATWFAGRAMLSGREVSGTARTLTVVKDGLMIASLATGLGSFIAGRILGKRTRSGNGASQVRSSGGIATNGESAQSTMALRRAAGGLGIVNLLANIAIMGVTTMLAMEGNRSALFAARSRFLR